MGERRHEPDPKPEASPPKPEPKPDASPPKPAPQAEPTPTPAVATTEDLGAIDTACAALDNEIERFLRLLGARDTLRLVTAQVRALLAAVQPLQQRKDAIGKEIAQLQGTIAEWQERTRQAQAQHDSRVRESDEEVRQMRTLLEKTRSEVAAERTALREDVARAREGQQGEVRTLLEVTEARKRDLTKMLEEAEQAHTQRLADMQDELERMQEQIEEAKRLRDQLTAIRG